MKGLVIKRGDTWTYRFDAGIIDGKRKRPSKGGFRTKKECENALREAIHRYENGGYIEPKKITFESFVLEYLEYINLNRKITTYNRYKELTEKYLIPYIGSLNLVNITHYHIEQLLQNIKSSTKISSSTLQGIYTLLNGILNRALKSKIIISNPCVSVERPKREKVIYNTLSTDEIKSIFKVLNFKNEYDYMFYIALNITLELGLRRGELGGLQWDNIDFNKNRISIHNNLVYSNGKVYMGTPKTLDSIRNLLVSDKIISLLIDLKKRQQQNKIQQGEFYVENEWDNLVMRWFSGHYIHPSYYTSKFKKVLKLASIEKNVRWHDLRHTNATFLLQSGINSKVIQERLGHKDIQTTLNIYSHVTDSMQLDAINKLNSIL